MKLNLCVIQFFFLHCGIIYATGGTEILAISGDRVELPCPLKPRNPTDRPILVLWYKKSTNKPIYSFDARSTRYPAGQRFPNKTLFGNRSYFISSSSPPVLVLEPVVASDGGDFICRLDYVNSPTTSTNVKLKVTVLPSHPGIYWKGQRVVGPIGPLSVNTEVHLTCITHGGKPQPKLVWWLEGHKILPDLQETEHYAMDDETRAVLKLNITRDLNMKELSCQILTGTKYSRTPLLETSVLLNITLPPLGMTIEGTTNPVAEGTTLTLTCLAWGSNPPAKLAWWKSGKKLEGLVESIRDGGNMSALITKVVVKQADHFTTMTCRASNPSLQTLPLIQSRKLNVTYKPKLQLEARIPKYAISSSEGLPGRSQRVTVKSGSHVRLECSLNSNPPPSRIEWSQNGIIIESGSNAWSLLIGDATKKDTGSYTCSATNYVGKGTSLPYMITVEHAPECAKGWKERSQGVVMGTVVSIVCRVEALPSDNLSFTWAKLAGNHKLLQYPTSLYGVDGLTSRIKISVRSKKDYGTISCQAKNRAGLQNKPCKVHLVPASAPSPVINCSTAPGNRIGSIFIQCAEGFDGGFPQKFILIASQFQKTIANITRDFPEWTLEGLKIGSSISFQVYSFNVRGKSNSTYIDAIVKEPQIMKDEGYNVDDDEYPERIIVMPIIGIIIGVGGALAIALLVIAMFFLSSRQSAHEKIYDTPSDMDCSKKDAKSTPKNHVIDWSRQGSSCNFIGHLPSASEARSLINHYGHYRYIGKPSNSGSSSSELHPRLSPKIYHGYHPYIHRQGSFPVSMNEYPVQGNPRMSCSMGNIPFPINFVQDHICDCGDCHCRVDSYGESEDSSTEECHLLEPEVIQSPGIQIVPNSSSEQTVDNLYEDMLTLKKKVEIQKSPKCRRKSKLWNIFRPTSKHIPDEGTSTKDSSTYKKYDGVVPYELGEFSDSVPTSQTKAEKIFKEEIYDPNSKHDKIVDSNNTHYSSPKLQHRVRINPNVSMESVGTIKRNKPPSGKKVVEGLYAKPKVLGVKGSPISLRNVRNKEINSSEPIYSKTLKSLLSHNSSPRLHRHNTNNSREINDPLQEELDEECKKELHCVGSGASSSSKDNSSDGLKAQLTRLSSNLHASPCGSRKTSSASEQLYNSFLDEIPVRLGADGRKDCGIEKQELDKIFRNCSAFPPRSSTARTEKRLPNKGRRHTIQYH